MRRLFVPPAQLASRDEGGRLALTPAQARHLQVLRLAEGAALELFDGEGGRFAAALVAGEAPALQVGAALPRAAAGRVQVALAQALCKADKLELVIQKACELGVERLVPFAAERSVVKLDAGRAEAKLERWRRIAQEAARQCGRADVPEVEAPCSFEALLARAGGEARAVLLDTGEVPLRLSQAVRGAERLLLAVGPEGGFSPREREQAEVAGFLVASLGALVLRTETAGLAALAVVRHLAGELG